MLLDTSDDVTIGALAVLAILPLGAGLVAVRGVLGQPGVVLLLMLPVVAAGGFGGRVAGAAAAAAAALAFNFFHAGPYLLLWIKEPRDTATMLLIVVVGLGAAEVTRIAAGHRATLTAQTGDQRPNAAARDDNGW